MSPWLAQQATTPEVDRPIAKIALLEATAPSQELQLQSPVPQASFLHRNPPCAQPALQVLSAPTPHQLLWLALQESILMEWRELDANRALLDIIAQIRSTSLLCAQVEHLRLLELMSVRPALLVPNATSSTKPTPPVPQANIE
jgi:hypothetical protein